MLEPQSTFPLTAGQEGIWLAGELDGDGCLYNEQAALRLRGMLDGPALERALRELVNRHEALRTGFPRTDGGVRQVIGSPPELSLPAVAGRGGSPAEREAHLLRVAEAELWRPFSLENGPLLRAALLRLGAQEHVLLLTVHHLVFDGWSRTVLIRELATLYAAFARGEPSPLSPLPGRFGEFAARQVERAARGDFAAPMAYWRAHLEGAPPMPLLPGEPLPGGDRAAAGARESFRLPPSLVADLQALARGEETTLFVVMLATFQALLHRYSGQPDLVVLTPFASRTRAETEAVIGCFVNLLPLRANLAGDPVFRVFLHRTRATVHAAQANQEAPGEWVMAECWPRQSAGRGRESTVVFQQGIPHHRFPELAGSKRKSSTSRR